MDRSIDLLTCNFLSELQFSPGNPSELLITSADSRIRVFVGVNLVYKFKGTRLETRTTNLNLQKPEFIFSWFMYVQVFETRGSKYQQGSLPMRTMSYVQVMTPMYTFGKEKNLGNPNPG